MPRGFHPKYAIQHAKHLPDYLNDLNEMMRAIIQLVSEGGEIGAKFLNTFRDVMEIDHEYTCLAYITAPCEKLAETYLKTLNLYEK